MDKRVKHPLEVELFEQLSADPSIFEFLHTKCLDGLFFRDIDSNNQEWMSDSFWQLLGYNIASITGDIQQRRDIIHPDDLMTAMDNFTKHCENPAHPYDQIVRYRHKNGSDVWVRCRGMVIRNTEGKPIRMLGVHNDITKLKETEALLTEKNIQLEKLARHDFLTSLYNRFAFGEIFEQQVLLSAREQTPLSLAMIDVDHFKNINDSFGHQFGDTVLLNIADQLQSLVRDSDILARFGGEEFIVLMFNTNHQEAKLAAERVRHGIENNIKIEHNSVTVSIGVSTFGEKSIAGIDLTPTEIYDKMVSRADKALYKAKQTGRNNVCD